LLAGVVMGGLGFAATAIVAGIFVEFVPNISSNISPAFDGLVEGVIIVVIMLVARKGLFGLLQAGLNKLSGSTRPQVAEGADRGAEVAAVAADRPRPAIAPQERA